MLIYFFPKYSYAGASSRYRTYQYIPLYKQNGVECVVYPLFDDTHINNINKNKNKLSLNLLFSIVKRVIHILRIKHNDIIFIEKELIPFFPPFFEWYLSYRKIKYILDYDDAIIHNYNLSESKIIRLLFSNKIPYIQSKAHAVINGSQYLYKLSLFNNKNSFFIPTSLNPNKYFPPQKIKSKQFIIGWIGSQSTSKLIVPILETIEDFCYKNNIKIHLIGFDKKLLNTQHIDIYKFIKWEEDTETQEIFKFDIGISPSIDTPFARGKCAFKTIQYMACSKPVVASPIGANEYVVEHGVTGFHARNKDEWLKFLKFLFLNPQVREKYGKAGRKKVEIEYSINKNYKKYIKIFKSLT